MKILFIFLLFTGICYAGMESPPPSDDIPQYNWMQSAQHYMTNPTIPQTTTNPDGTRTGKLNQVIMYYTTSGQYLMICASPPTVWRGTKLEIIP